LRLQSDVRDVIQNESLARQARELLKGRVDWGEQGNLTSQKGPMEAVNLEDTGKLQKKCS
jgi:hypothetical protein